MHEELWNANHERASNFFRLDPNESIIRWAWTRHSVCRKRYSAAMSDPDRAHLRFFRVRNEQGLEEAFAVLAGECRRA